MSTLEKPRQATKTIAVAGGGISGAFGAYFLAERGFKVFVIDPGRTRFRASSNNPGGINPHHGPGIPGAMSAFAMQCYRLHLAEWGKITELSGIDFKGRTISRIFVAFSEGEAGRLQRTGRLYSNTEGFSAEWMDSAALHRYDPRLNPKALGGLLTTGNGVVDCESYTPAILKAAFARGAEHKVGRLTGVEIHGKRVHKIRTECGSLRCDEVLFATGPWLDQLKTSLNASLPVRPVKGELLLTSLGTAGPTHDISWGQFGVYHHDKDLFWLGGTFVDPVRNCAPTYAGAREILEGVSQILPGLKQPSVMRHIAGLRPVTPDGMPILGRLPGYDNVHLTLGGGSKGMLLSSGLGQAVADMIGNGCYPGDLSFLSPDRFFSKVVAKRESVS